MDEPHYKHPAVKLYMSKENRSSAYIHRTVLGMRQQDVPVTYGQFVSDRDLRSQVIDEVG